MKQFVTGGAGFIGSNYVRYVLAHTSDEVTVFDALTYAASPGTLSDVDGCPRFRFVKGDVCDRAAVKQAMAGHDVIVHIAAESSVDRSIVSQDEFVRTNCLGTNVMCDIARQLKVRRFLHVSTDEVYGSIEEGSWTEEEPLGPRSLYSSSKAGSDLIALSYFTMHHVPVIVVRSSNNFGPFQHPEKLIPLFTTDLLDGKEVHLYGDGLHVRDWIHVVDNCAALHTLLLKGKAGEIYNVGGGNEVTNKDITKELLLLCGKPNAGVRYVADRPGHDRRYSVNCGKVRQLGWAPQYSFKEALAETVEWYACNRWWWEPLKVSWQEALSVSHWLPNGVTSHAHGRHTGANEAR